MTRVWARPSVRSASGIAKKKAVCSSGSVSQARKMWGGRACRVGGVEGLDGVEVEVEGGGEGA
jgi:hypothetical protein